MPYAFVIIIVLFFVVLGLAIPFAIGFFVYQDAKKRGMDAILWALVAALVPSFIGLIIYFVERSNHSGVICYGCGIQVPPGYVNCPRCGVQVKPVCPTCGRPLEKGWNVCTNCGRWVGPNGGTYTNTQNGH